jgi:molybdopterin/thiamine biosynthesis adenylyltransferase
VDHDHITTGNRNRQILFRSEHDGLAKAHVACEALAGIDSHGSYRPVTRRVQGADDLADLGPIDLMLATPDNNQARLVCADAAKQKDILFGTGATDARSGYTLIQPPGLDSFRSLTGIHRSQSPARRRRTASCAAAQSATCITNMVIGGLLVSELRAEIAGAEHQNLRFFVDSVPGANCFVGRATHSSRDSKRGRGQT